MLDEILWRSLEINGRHGKNDEQITIHGLTKKMADLAAAKERESYRLKKRVEKDFKGEIVIININGNVDVVRFHSTASKILQDFQNREASVDIELEKMRIIKASTDIIKNKIKQWDNNTACYPRVE